MARRRFLPSCKATSFTGGFLFCFQEYNSVNGNQATIEKTLLIIVPTILLLLLLAYYFFGSSGTYKIKEISGTFCTFDIPSSDCTEIEVVTKNKIGIPRNFYIPAYSNGEGREQYEYLWQIVDEAAGTNQEVRLTIKKQKYITDAQPLSE